jgi:hypothetical protein
MQRMQVSLPKRARPGAGAIHGCPISASHELAATLSEQWKAEGKITRLSIRVHPHTLL